MTRLTVVECKRAESVHTSDQIVQANQAAEVARSTAFEVAALAAKLHAQADGITDQGRSLRASADRLFTQAAHLHEQARTLEAHADRVLKSCFH